VCDCMCMHGCLVGSVSLISSHVAHTSGPRPQGGCEALALCADHRPTRIGRAAPPQCVRLDLFLEAFCSRHKRARELPAVLVCLEHLVHWITGCAWRCVTFSKQRADSAPAHRLACPLRRCHQCCPHSTASSRSAHRHGCAYSSLRTDFRFAHAGESFNVALFFLSISPLY
jgi:hypothetical protein